jgi:hypothetical protein
MATSAAATKAARSARVAAARPDDEGWVDAVTAALREGLAARAAAARANGGAASDLGSPVAVADRMLASVPTPSPWRALGPLFSTKGVARVLGDVSRQAVEDRRKRGRIIALRTADGTWVYPAFQFDQHNRPIAGLTDAFSILVDAYGDWTAASAMLGAQTELGGRSIVEHLTSGGAVAPLLELCRAWAASWGR